MKPLELLITALIYVSTLLLGQRVIGLIAPDAAEGSFVVAAIAASLAAGWMFHRRQRQRAPAGVVLLVGAMLSLLAIGLGLLTQTLWQILALPAVSVPLAALGTLFFPMVLFATMRAALRDSSQGNTGISRRQLLIAAGTSLLLSAVALAMPLPGRARATLTQREFPGLKVALPDWQQTESSSYFENGNIKLIEPGGRSGFVSLRWTDSDPVQVDDYVKVVTGGTLQIRDRTSTPVGGHEGTTFLLDSPKIPGWTLCTIWNCPQDHRVLWITTFLDVPQSSVQATHQKIVDSVACHAISQAAVADRIFPSFVPPSLFGRDDSAESPTWFGPNNELIVLEPAVSGHNALVDSDITPEQVAARIKGIGLLDDLAATPTVQTVRDAQGHDRKIWSAVGSTRDAKTVQVDWMVWYCNKRNLTFLAIYRTAGKHELREGIEALLPAACHTD